MAEELLIDKVSDRTDPHYEPFGWHDWPQHPWMSYQFRRALGETSEGGGSVSECFLAASRMIPGDKESWHREWKRIADFNQKRGDEELAKGHVQTAKNCWLRASEYYRQAELPAGLYFPGRSAAVHHAGHGQIAPGYTKDRNRW